MDTRAKDGAAVRVPPPLPNVAALLGGIALNEFVWPLPIGLASGPRVALALLVGLLGLALLAGAGERMLENLDAPVSTNLRMLARSLSTLQHDLSFLRRRIARLNKLVGPHNLPPVRNLRRWVGPLAVRVYDLLASKVPPERRQARGRKQPVFNMGAVRHTVELLNTYPVSCFPGPTRTQLEAQRCGLAAPEARTEGTHIVIFPTGSQ